jgi:uncharacterized membrane protein YidH (DUF202 family)
LIDPLAVPPLLARPPLRARPPFPALARFGIAVIAFGLLLDFVEHDLVSHVTEPQLAGFPLSEHAAHLVVLVGMVLVLVGIVRTGMRLDRRRPHQHRSPGHAVR